MFASLDRAEAILSKQRYLAGTVLTEADLRLFTTMVRFGSTKLFLSLFYLNLVDPAYVLLFKCNLKTVEHGYPHILKLLRRIYQYDGGVIQNTVNNKHIKDCYFISEDELNPNRIVPLGNGPDLSVPVDG